MIVHKPNRERQVSLVKEESRPQSARHAKEVTAMPGTCLMNFVLRRNVCPLNVVYPAGRLTA